MLLDIARLVCLVQVCCLRTFDFIISMSTVVGLTHVYGLIGPSQPFNGWSTKFKRAEQ